MNNQFFIFNIMQVFKRNQVTILIMVAAAILLTSQPLWANVTMVIDPDDHAGQSGISIVELNEVEVVILGSEHFDVEDVVLKSLRFGVPGSKNIRPRRGLNEIRDVNNDAFEDLVLVFKMSDHRLKEFRDPRNGLAKPVIAELRGRYRDKDNHGRNHNHGRNRFKTYANVVGSSQPFDYCSLTGKTGEARNWICTWPTTYASSMLPLDFSSLIGQLNAASNLRVTNNSMLQIDAWGGNGHKGRKSCSNSSASGGKAGQARVTVSVGELLSLLNKVGSSGPYLYVGQQGVVVQAGGSSSLVSSFSATDSANPLADSMLILVAGGGGGASSTNRDACKKGKAGGDGGAAVNASDAVDKGTAKTFYVAGETGNQGSSQGGFGGSLTGQGVGGKPGVGNGTAANTTIVATRGGDHGGGLSTVYKSDDSGEAVVITTYWYDIDSKSVLGNGGSGTYISGKEGAGSGGGGYGGGGGGYALADSNIRYGGGGGGGSYATKSTFDTFWDGSSSVPAIQMVIQTFE